jgi:hypothetical protein
MVTTVTTFFVAIVVAFMTLSYSAWEVRTGRRVILAPSPVPKLSFRTIEKSVLYLLKTSLQSIVIIGAKFWFLGMAKLRKFSREKLPKIYRFLGMTARNEDGTKKPSFARRAIMESRTKIKRIRERIKREHE